ncbi:MAG: class I SAM-dependent methyltransferase [Pseudodesulfovibrio sp.]|uniref:Methyltransferase type 11 n=1 Tax=Pseudodesulfovibrio aespoeensis (strain ATCC 700646 / DSM 10631 / Aspo-2) TaxID=643562 RepID=E6VR49_PSEA9|nr:MULTISPECIES: class I SAM-dependent methyltransferase [Pseudodesulfovibrio]MBU4379053.1 class I SAM-dependent methyltransferase [Pseudomonadota bacterium]ADU64133.1 Methyltransferase type 11 [Pseudodesulfovibrio aespoeensis Aspo-2]MBU4475453.1 class I SAM-dependent methyltransferase [Pseudomonadota bacterium]MBU4517631.1 class I SAM-dependent methyltransferase [Pseudomonadota bacterium]MBU4521359.1 class I SAM-dependent methyltransferase [Pseudomonadota bacterium]
MGAEVLLAGEVHRHPSSYVDPHGFVFSHEGNIYRAIKDASGDFYAKLFSDGTIERFMDNGLVASSLSEVVLELPDVAFIIQHERIEPETYCVEWCPAMLLDAARLTVSMLKTAFSVNATLQDAYPWNILFNGATPVFLDLTSIAPRKPGLVWPALEQFHAFFLRPLALATQGKGNVARDFLYNNIGGISFESFWNNTSTGYKASHPGQALGFFISSRVKNRQSLQRKLKHRALSERPIPEALFSRFCRGLEKRLDAFDFSTKEDIWSQYYREIDPLFDTGKKLSLVGEVLDRLAPASVLDAGCNTGAFSVLAAQKGARVMSVDSSEASINKLYHYARQNNLEITPVVADLLCPTPSFGFMGSQYPPLFKRAQSEMVFALALMHHLHIPGRQSFERISRMFSQLSTKHLLFEFVDMDDQNNDLIGAGRDIRYSFEDVMCALKKHFPTISVMDSDRPTRKLLLCTKNG